jgi:hypothetical protein
LKSSPESTPKGTRKSNPGTFILSFSEMLEPFPTVRDQELEAFFLFDRGEGGFIYLRRWKLWGAMWRLGFLDGACYEDCQG